MQQWYYSRGDEDVGPVSFDLLSQLAARAEIQTDTLVWTDGMEEWVEARRVPELHFGAVAPQGVQRISKSGAAPRGDGAGRGRARRSGRMPLRVAVAAVIDLVVVWYGGILLLAGGLGVEDPLIRSIFLILGGTVATCFFVTSVGLLSRKNWARILQLLGSGVFGLLLITLISAFVVAAGRTVTPGQAVSVLAIVLPPFLVLGQDVKDWFRSGFSRGRRGASRRSSGGASSSSRASSGRGGAARRGGSGVRRGARRGGKRRL